MNHLERWTGWWKSFWVLTLLLSLTACGGGDNADSGQLASSLTLTTSTDELFSDRNNYAVLEAKVLKEDGTPLPNANVTFETNIGSFAENQSLKAQTVKTDVNGLAKVHFYANKAAGTAVISAFIGGYNQTVTVKLLPGDADVSRSSITANPSALPADGSSTSGVTVVLLDKNGNVVADDTLVTLQASAGAITSENPVKTKSGRATFTYQSPSTAGTVTLSLIEYPELTQEIDITAIPANNTVGSLTLTTSVDELFSDRDNHAVLKALVKSQDGNVLPNSEVVFEVNIGSFDESQSVKKKTVSTNESGIAEVKFYANKAAGTAVISAFIGGYNQTVTVKLLPGNPDVNRSSISANPSALPADGSSTSEITVVLLDKNGNVVADDTPVTLQASAGAITSENPVKTKSGRATFTYQSPSTAGTVTLSLIEYPELTQEIDITAIPANNTVGSLTLTTSVDELFSDRDNHAVLKALVKSQDGNVLPNSEVVFEVNIGSFDESQSVKKKTVSTNESGIAEVKFYANKAAGTAVISAFIGGYNQTVTVKLLPGNPDVNRSSISANPSALPADGSSTSEITVVLLDKNGNVVADDTPVTLQASAGAITSENPVKTKSGRATFTYQAPSAAGTVTLSVVEYPGLSQNVEIGSVSSTEAASMAIEVANTHLFVNGVGKQDSTSIAITVKTAAGNPILDADEDVNNLIIRFKSRPNGGEKIEGENASGTIVNSDATGAIQIRTQAGVATVNLKSGTLPGVVELEVEALQSDGTAYNPAVKTVISQVSISSGPPKTINISWPPQNAVTDLNNGLYRRNGVLSVTDQYGNAVPDGTVINLGAIDSVIVSNSSATGSGVNVTSPNDSAVVTANSPTLTDSGNAGLDFSSVSITRNDTSRFVLSNDRVLILNADSEDKSRFVVGVNTDNTLTVQKAYQNDKSNLTYFVGTSALGSQILGHNELEDIKVAGQAVTKEGAARIYLQYPADNEHILTGCYQSDPTKDTRPTAEPAGSAQVWVVAESSETGATTIDNRGCFSALTPWKLNNNSGISSISSSNTIQVSVEDAGEILLPFVTVSASVNYTNNTGGLSVSATGCTTNASGSCSVSITVTGGASGDSAEVILSTGGDAESLIIGVTIP